MAIGDVQFTGGNGAAYTLNFGCNSLCRLEAETGKTYGAVMTQLREGDPPIALMRQVVRALLVEPKEPTLEQAGDILDDIGGADAMLLAIRQVSEPAPKGPPR